MFNYCSLYCLATNSELYANYTNQIKSNQIYFSKMQDKYATITLRIAEHRQENMAKPEGLKHTKLLALLLR